MGEGPHHRHYKQHHHDHHSTNITIIRIDKPSAHMPCSPWLAHDFAHAVIVNEKRALG